MSDTWFGVGRSVEVLQRTPAVLRAMLHGLDDFWSRGDYGPDTFSPFDVVGHLIHADRTNWVPRLRLVLAGDPGAGANEPGEPPALPPFDRYAMYETSSGKSMDDLLDEFTAVRAEVLAELCALNLTPRQLDLPGQHRQLGRVALRHLLAAWPVHDLGHIHQIAKAMAYQCRDAVGPWRELLIIQPRR
jgi:hypothetical protein